MKAARQAWFEGQPDLEPERLVFIDESGFTTKMARLRGWARKGERCRAAIPHGHWKTTTFVGGLTLAGFRAPMTLDGPMDGEAFLAWCEQMLAPELAPGDIVIMEPGGAQGGGRRRGHRGGRRAAPVFAALQSRLQSDRERVRQAQGARAQRPPPAPATPSGRRSATASSASSPTSAQTSSPTPDTTWIKGNPL